MGGKYVYGIIQTDEEVSFAAKGLDGSPLHTMVNLGLGCVLSDYSGPEFASLSREELVRRLLAYQSAVERVMESCTVLPVKFGTVLGSSAEVSRFLPQGHTRFMDALAQLRDKVEVEVAATWDTGHVLREIGQETEIRCAREKAIASGSVGLKERVGLGQMVKECLEKRRAVYREQITDFLRPLAVDVQPNALVADEMVVNLAFLVERNKQEEFDNQVRQLDNLFHGQLNFRVIGPLPVYSFSTVGVSRPNWEMLANARRVLGLPEVISELVVRKAYRELAARSHPDLNPGDGRAREQWNRIQEAAALILTYCRGAGCPGDLEKSLHLTQEAVERTFIINIGRSATEILQPCYGGL